MKKLFVYSIPALLLLVPVFFVSAQTAEFGNVDDSLQAFLDILDTAVLVIMGLAVVYFLWGLSLFILGAGDEDKRGKGKSIMIWGIVALVVMVSVWGIVSFFQSALGVENGDDIQAPNILSN